MSVLKNARQELFCQWIAKGKSADEAYKKAGYKTANMKAATARGMASTLRSKPIIVSRIKELGTAGANKAIIDISDVIIMLKQVAMADVGEAFDDENNMLPVRKMPKHLRLALAGVESEEIVCEGRVVGHTKKIKLTERNKSIENLGRYLKMFVDVVKHEGLDSLADDVNDAKGRTK